MISAIRMVSPTTKSVIQNMALVRAAKIEPGLLINKTILLRASTLWLLQIINIGICLHHETYQSTMSYEHRNNCMTFDIIVDKNPPRNPSRSYQKGVQ